MGYLYLLGAIASEVAGTSLLKSTNGFTRLLPTIGSLALYAAAFALLALVVKSVPVGTAYAIWSGLGTASIVLIGFRFFDERPTPIVVVGLVLIIVGVVLVSIHAERSSG